MKKVLAALVLFGLALGGYAQVKTEKLTEVEILGMNYAYLSKLNKDEPSQRVKELHKKVAAYDLFNNGTYNPEYDQHFISFFIPEGYIHAQYDNNKELLSTIEKFKDVQLPDLVKDELRRKYPGWEIIGDIYKIRYHFKTGVEKKYRITLTNNGERKIVKIDAEGVFL